ncbi:MAG: ABC transporter ATP-binding protein [Ndongobacter sp.]|nr:ABC transporter ATP-binding protein [Ndongobacter sp.]
MMLLEVKDLRSSFFTQSGEVQAVRGVTFELKEGDALGIVGESGSGKSVSNMNILQLNADNSRVKDGEILFEGSDLLKLTRKELRRIRGKDIAMIFQDPMSSLNPLMTIGKQVGEVIRIHEKGVSAKEVRERVIELLNLVRIPEAEKRYDSYPHEFSGGMRQRVMIAMALALNPKILIADEPTTALDVTVQDQILRLLADLQKKRRMSIIFVTHDLAVVAQLCNRVLVMYAGMVMEEAGIEELFDCPAHPYTIGLFRSMPNPEQNKDERLQSIGGSPPDMLQPPKGCPFAPRCPHVRQICLEEVPPFVEVSKGHRSLCWLQTAEGLLQEDNPFAKEAAHE